VRHQPAFPGSPVSIGCIDAVRHQLVRYKESARVGGVAGFEPIKNSIVLARPYHYTRGPLPPLHVFGIFSIVFVDFVLDHYIVL